MIKLLSVSLLSLISCGCHQYNMALPAPCGIEKVNNISYEKYCVEKDSVASSFKLANKDSYKSHTVFGHSSGSVAGPQVDWILGGDNTLIDFRHHYFDASANEAAWINFRGKELLVKNGILLNINEITLGNTYSAPEFNKKFQKNNDVIKYGYLYSNGDLNFKNLTFNSFKLSVSNFNIIQWNTTISNSDIIVNNSLITQGSLSHINYNHIYKKTTAEVITHISIKRKSAMIDTTQIILPDQPDSNLAALYIKFSPDVRIN